MTNINEKRNHRNKLRYIVPIVLILLIVAAILVVPRYNRYLREKRAAEVKTALEALRSGVDQSWKNAGTISGITVEGALKDAGISQKVLEKWQFVIAWKLADIYTTEMVNKLKDVNTNEMVYVSPYRMIMAVATSENPLREGTKAWFEGDTNTYHGFGIDDKVEPDWITMFPNP